MVIAIARFAGATPTPGGLAGVEAAMTGLIVLLSGASPTTATAAVLVYRGVFFWAPLLPGGVVVGVVSLAD